MENDAATLYCPNDKCQAPNPLTHNFCQQCRTPLPKRYLWTVGESPSVGNSGEILADRYLVISKSILLDTKPGLVPNSPSAEYLQVIRPYLRLIPYRLHVPQVYGVLTLTDGGSEQEILLLEKPPLNVDGAANIVQLCSQMSTAWGSATSMRQLSWLWQTAQLWQPLINEGVASSLLDPHLLRVEGSLVRLLELLPDLNSAPELPQIGEFWQQLVPTAKPAIAEFLGEICRCLHLGEIHSSEQLVAILDRGLVEIGRSQTPTIKIATKSDTGPSRQRNEDACYPSSGTTITKPPQPSALSIVCDGIGGHEGGNVASNLAIETIQQQVQHLTNISSDHIDPATLLEDLEQAAAVANDKISQINDSEQRTGRQRMGTTLVMALPIAHSMYIAHVGDSRAYLITRYNCYQVTLDDDVASREVRLGYATYRDALHQGASGSLVQALGMSSSSSLHPTAQRFILDEDCVFLLCSDGLSDFDRVEQYWDTEILPIITNGLNVVDVTEKLLEIANTKNGHDNVTIALVHYQVKYSEPKSILSKAQAVQASISASESSPKTARVSPHRLSNKATQVIPTTKKNFGLTVPIQLFILAAVVVGGVVLGYVLHNQPDLLSRMKAFFTTSTKPQQFPSVTPTKSAPQVAQEEVIETNTDITLNRMTPPATEAIAPVGSVLQIITHKKEASAKSTSQDNWVHLRVCSIGQITTSPTSIPLLKAGDEARIDPKSFKLLNVTPLKGGNASKCQLPSKEPAVQSTPQPTQNGGVLPNTTPTGANSQ